MTCSVLSQQAQFGKENIEVSKMNLDDASSAAMA